MRFYIVTPSFNQIDFLKRCVASVADQVAQASSPKPQAPSLPISVHHHIQDGGSTDGTVDWLRQYDAEVKSRRSGTGNPTTENLKPNTAVPGYTFSYESAPDNGMYDAINRGWLRAVDQVDHEAEDLVTSDFRPPTSNPAHECVLAHLNCDEQYLPGALQCIADYFSNHQKVDVAMADMIVVDNDGAYICHRRSLKPNALLSRICCVGMTTTTFQRISVARDKKVLFDTSWRNIGDMVWYNKLHRAGVRFGVCNELVSLFADTGDNLNLTEEAIRERKRYAKEYLWGLRWPTRMMSKMYSLRRYLKDYSMTAPNQYALYWSDLDKREIRKIEKATPLWHRKGPVGS